MKLMTNGKERIYVPDCNVNLMKNQGYVVEGEPEPEEQEPPVCPGNYPPGDDDGHVEEPAAEEPGEEETAGDGEPEPEGDQEAHDDQGEFVCSECGKSYKSKAALERHIREKHSEK